MTRTGVVIGTPQYMAPELAGDAKNAEPSADIFSLGTLAHELLTGRLRLGPEPRALSLPGLAQESGGLVPLSRSGSDEPTCASKRGGPAVTSALTRLTQQWPREPTQPARAAQICPRLLLSES